VKIPSVAIGGAVLDVEPRFDTVLLHELGHLLGLADLYYEHPMQNDPYPMWGGLHFSAMGDYDYDSGAILPDAESRRALGWQERIVMSGRKRLTLQPAAQGGKAVKLGMMVDGRKEYFLVEARGAFGAIDKGVKAQDGKPVYGLAVYHVDWKVGPLPDPGAFTSRLLNCLDCDPFHPFVRNVESNGAFALVYRGSTTGLAARGSGVGDEQVLFTSGSLRSLDNVGPLTSSYRYTSTNFYDGTPSGIAIEDIVVNEDKSVTATFVAPVVANPCADVQCAPLEVCQASGDLAGNCVAMTETDPVPSFRPGAQAGGCSTAASGWLAALALGALLAGRKRRAS
jgi:MYXO-CTERM domain-containing protein